MLLRLTAAYAAGACCVPPRDAAHSAVLLGLVLCAVLVRRGRRARLGLAWLPAVALAATLGAWVQHGAARGPTLAAGDVRVAGWIASRPETSRFGTSAWFAVDSIAAAETSACSPTGAARVRLHSRSALPDYGQRMRVQGTWRPPRGPRNFHAFDERGLLAAHGAFGILNARDLEPVPGVAGNRWQRDWIEPARTRLARQIDATLAPREAGILTALVLGIDDGIDVAVQETWRSLGMTHVLAVSGMHVSLVATALVAITGSPRRRRGCVALLAGLAAYAALAGLAPSVLRAAAMAAWAAIALHLGRWRGGIHTLGLASATLLVGNPPLRHDLGFQLSCASTLGILIWAAPLQALGRRLQARRRWGRPAAFFATSVGLGLAAQLGTLPLVHARFGYVSLAAPVADLALVPLANAALVLGLAGAPLALVVPELARPVWIVAGALLHVTLRLADGIVRQGDPRWFLPTDAVAIALTTIAGASALLAGLQAGKRRWRPVTVCLALTVMALGVLALRTLRPSHPAWRLEVLDVGQGDALLLGIGSEVWLIDAGDMRPVDQGERVILPHLRRLGIRRLRGLVLTHPHLDHCGGVGSVLAGIRVDTLYMGAVSADAAAYAPLRRHAVPVRFLHAGSRLALGGQYEAQILWPPVEATPGTDANAQSLVLWGSGPGLPHVLAMGDLEADGEAELVARYADLLAAAAPDFLVLKAGHHGSRTSSTPALLDACDPELAFVSVGDPNRYGHPAPATLAALAARDCHVLRTDRGGAIRLVLRGGTLWLERPSARPRAVAAAAGAIDAPGQGP